MWHRDTEKIRKIQNFENVVNRRETDSAVSLAKIRGLESLILKNNGKGTGLKSIFCTYENNVSEFIH